MGDSTDRAAAALTPARFAFAAIDIKLMLKISKFSISLAEVLERGAARCNGILQHLADGWNQAGNTGFADLPGLAFWGDCATVKGFADVYVTKSGNDSLIQ